MDRPPITQNTFLRHAVLLWSDEPPPPPGGIDRPLGTEEARVKRPEQRGGGLLSTRVASLAWRGTRPEER